MAYYKLEKHWGKYVPILRSYGTTACGSIVYVATELIEGFPLGTGNSRNKLVSVVYSFSLFNCPRQRKVQQCKVGGSITMGA
jgi:hypothetical protein